MSGDRGGFTPKGFVKLRDAIEAIGRAIVPGWTGAEQEPENWELLDGPHVQLRERAERVWKRLRPEFHDRPLSGEGDKCVVLDDRGEILPVPAGIWGLPEAETLLRDCAFDKREIFVGEAFLEAQLYVHYNPFGSQARRLKEDQAGLSVGAGSGVETSPEAKPESDERVAGPAAPAAPRKRSAPGRPNKGVVAAETYRRVFPDGHEDLGYSWDSAIAKITNNGAPKVSKRTLQRGLEKLRKQKI